MKAQQVLKVVLVVAILMSLAKLLVGRRRPSWNVQPYGLERFDSDVDYEYSDMDSDMEDEEVATSEEGSEASMDDDDDVGADGAQEGYMNNSNLNDEDYEDEDAEDEEYEDEDAEDEDAEDEEYEDEDYEVEGFTATAQPAGMMNVATDLLPKPTWKDQNFSEFAPKSLLGQNFLDTKKYIGVDTKGSSLRNPSYDLRSTPTIPRKDVGPWAQSTIDTDLYRKPLE